MNPALDIATSIPLIGPTHKMRCAAPRYHPGGGGINVARVAHVLGVPATTGAPGRGHSGEAVHDLMSEGLTMRRVRVGGPTREFQRQRGDHRPAVPVRATRSAPHRGRADRVPGIPAPGGVIGIAESGQNPGRIWAESGRIRGRIWGRRSWWPAEACRPACHWSPYQAGGGPLRGTERDAAAGHLRRRTAERLFAFTLLCGSKKNLFFSFLDGNVHVLVSMGADGAVLVSEGRAAIRRGPDTPGRQRCRCGRRWSPAWRWE